MKNSLFKFTILFSLSNAAIADLPLTVENLLSDKGKARIEFSTTYVNSERRGIDSTQDILVQTSPTSFVSVPIISGESNTNTDIAVVTAGARYGLTHKDEIYARISGIALESRAKNSIGQTFNTSDTQFSDAWVGVNHKFRDDIDKPALFGFAEIQIAEKQQNGSTVKGKSFVVGATTYQTYDPIVLSLTGAARVNKSYKINDINFKKGNSLSISPSVGFAVNDKVTLSTGVNWRIKNADRIDWKKYGIRKTQTSLDFGLGYAIGKKDTLNFSVQPQVSGDGDVQMNFNWIHHLGKN
jgi:hypothetical protein